MTTLNCLHVRHAKFIDRDIVFNIDFDDRFGGGLRGRIEKSVQLREEFKELGMAFHRNRVEVRFQVSYENRNSDEYRLLTNKVKEFCDTRCEGYWSWKFKRTTVEEDRRETYNYEMDLFFEHRDDMDLWLKEQGLVFRLTY